ncbi:hypothetical protein [Pseudonocardia sp. ICBG601]|uniref:hypothetical protein n=1 Tax=Pseudonocardia sp. ICBG601 TaxID=2846759 RepID=UPI001CF70A05|nr:hypothetical protein [Pseudonocardia sp. ICBG601]
MSDDITGCTTATGIEQRTSEPLDASLLRLLAETGMRIPFCMDALQERMAEVLGVPIVTQRIPAATSSGTGAVIYDSTEKIYKIMVQGATIRRHQDYILGHELVHIWRDHLNDPATEKTRFICSRTRIALPSHSSPAEQAKIARLNEMETEADAGGLILSSWTKRSRPSYLQVSDDPVLADLTYTLMGSRWK